jgi:NADH-quinone oxidoreductase subunit A
MELRAFVHASGPTRTGEIGSVDLSRSIDIGRVEALRHPSLQPTGSCIRSMRKRGLDSRLVGETLHKQRDSQEPRAMVELLPVLLFGVVAVVFAAGSIGVSNLVGPRRPNPTKLGAYESGNEPLADVPGTRFSVKFYLVAMLFLVFDVEAVFVYPWAVVLRELGWAGLWQMVVFLGILGVAFVYEIGRGGLEWD